MDSDSSFLVARLKSDAILADPLDWIASTESPYQSVDPIDLDDELNKVYRIYIKTYEKIDSKFNIKDKYGLFEYNRWILIEDSNGNLLAFALLKTTAFGLKIGIVSTNQSDEGKKAVREFIWKALFVDGVYAEVSDALERVVTKRQVPTVQANEAEKILPGKEIDIGEDGYHYTRRITGIGKRKKIMVGRPILTEK